MNKEKILNFVEEEINNLNYDNDNFLYIISTYLKSLEYTEPILELIPIIKKAITHLENQFDEIFLLVKSTEFEYMFLESNNKNLLNSLEYLIEILNKHNFIKEADKLVQIKTKLNLGYDRYFIQKNSKLIVEWFSPVEFSFEIYKEIDFNLETELIIILDDILKNKKFKKFNKIKKYLKDYPEKIYQNKSLELVNIQKSLFFDTTFEYNEFEDGKIKTSDFNSLYIAIKILEIINQQNE